MDELRHRLIDTNGIRLRIAEQGEGPLVLLLHGFPESWYSWRHQIPALAQAGYHVVAPDQRGYGGSDAPAEIGSYDILHLTADAAGIVDAFGEETAVVVGHDWGSPVAWHCALLYPDRFRAVAALSVPLVGRAAVPPLEIMKHMAGDNFFYILYFQEPGIAEEELERDVRRTLRLCLYVGSGDFTGDPGVLQKPKTAKFLDGIPEPERLPSWLSEEDLDYFAAEFERRGFRGALNWYRNIDRNWELTAKLADAKVPQPALFIAGERDGVLAWTPLEPMKQQVPNLRMLMLPGCGHWTQQERAADVNAALIGFLKAL